MAKIIIILKIRKVYRTFFVLSIPDKIPRKFLFLISQYHQTCANADRQRAELGDVCGDVCDVSDAI